MNIIKKENINGIYKVLNIVTLQVVIVLSAYSQSNILDDLQRTNSNTESTVIVYQDSTITDALLRQQPVTINRTLICREGGVCRSFQTIPSLREILRSR